MIKISVIIPIYNAKPFIESTIQDLLIQTYKNLEIVAVDDGSTDGTGEVLDLLAKKNSQIKVIHKENGGAPSARNVGLENAEGKYVGFLDSDDRVDPEMYGCLMDVAEKNNADIVACGFIQEFTDHIDIIEHHNNSAEPIIFEGCQDCFDSIEECANCIDGYTWNKIIKKEKIGSLRFYEDMKITDDLIFIYHLCEKVNRICKVNIPFYHYRYVHSSLTKASKAKVFIHDLERIDELIEWSSEKAPHCTAKLIRRYLFWNTKGCEVMLRDYDAQTYLQIQSNIRKYDSYIPTLKIRQRILVSSAKTAWWTYRIVGEVNSILKKCYVKIKKG